MHVVIVGAGIGGLATAIALRRVGMRVDVYERRSAMQREPLGSGLTLWSNAVRALAALGVESGVLAEARTLHYFDNQDWRGRPIARWHLADDAARYGQPSVNISRDALHRILLAASEGAVIHRGRTCVGVELGPAGVRVRFADGGSAEGDILVGADGVNSLVRRALFGPAPPRYAGYPVWRALVDLQHPAISQATHRQLWGRGARFGYYRVGPSGELYWWATTCAAEHDLEPVADRRSRLLDIFAGWAEPVEQILQ
ncbi:MAG: FAD-dependent monooxygenase, partial [Chloroflexota bacterium]|nr:FAD-dependent monooxygenase [Chloroflexota bacterium]